MANSKISALSAVTTLGATDEMVLAVSGATKKLTGANLKTQMPGYQYVRATITTDATSTATAEGSATAVITASAITPGAAVPVRVRFYAAAITTSATSMFCNLWRAIDGGAATDLGRIAVSAVAVDEFLPGVHGEYVDTPGAGSIVYSIRVWNGASGTATIKCTSPYMPAALTVTRV